MSETLRRTPLHDAHLTAGGKMVAFAGWDMPVQYRPGILREHQAVRASAGLFDVSHMGRFRLEGPGALDFADTVITNCLQKLDPGRLLYAAICHERGGVLDDVTAYRLDDGALLVVNASNRDKIWDWLQTRRAAWDGAPCTLTDQSDDLAQIALQGPRAQEILAGVSSVDLDPVGYYHYTMTRLFDVDDVLVSRNGYTGEDGFEIYLPANSAPQIWNGILDRGSGVGALPAGLGARDLLRLEMAYCLYGNELSESISPLEAGLGWTVRWKKPRPFVGQDALRVQKDAGPPRVLAGFEVEGRRLARGGESVRVAGREAGHVTSGGFSPSLDRGIGLALIEPAHAATGTALTVDVRGQEVTARVVDRPFYKDATHR